LPTELTAFHLAVVVLASPPRLDDACRKAALMAVRNFRSQHTAEQDTEEPAVQLHSPCSLSAGSFHCSHCACQALLAVCVGSWDAAKPAATLPPVADAGFGCSAAASLPL
jgi:hypothetical protein